MSLTVGQRTDALATSSPFAARTILLIALAAGLTGGFLAGYASQVPVVEVDLARLLRAMAALKLMLVAATAAAMLWRLQAPIAPRDLALYALTTAAMSAGPGLIWPMTQIVLGAALLHIGLFAALLLLWRDPEVSRLLAAAVARRRRATATPSVQPVYSAER